MPTLETLQSILLANWEAEESAGFPRLRRMPSTGVRRFLRHYDRGRSRDDAQPRGRVRTRGGLT
jgi:hypothetical protein